MGFWNKGYKKEFERTPLPPLPLWDQAKLITAEEAHSENLPLGWYVFKEDQLWYAMMPKGDQTGHVFSTPEHEPKDLEAWLGIPVPEIPAEKKEEPPVRELPSVEAKPLSIRERIRQMNAEKALAEKQEPLRKRNRRLYVRMSDAEYEDLEESLESTGMTMQSYILGALNCYVNQSLQAQLLQEISALALNLSTEIKLLQNVLKNSPDFKVEDFYGWNEILNVIKDREEMKREFRKIMEVSHGNR